MATLSSINPNQQNINNNNNVGPTNAELITENKRLAEKLAVSEDWCVRLQRQIQQLLQLPYNEAEKMRERMTNPELAIPLLQCYDATIREKEEENSKLSREIDRLRQMLRSVEAGGQEGLDTARLAEETARATMMRAEGDVQQIRSQAERLATENASLKERLMAMADSESRLKTSAAKDLREMEALNEKITELARANNRTMASLDDANRKLRQKAADESSDKNSSEAQKIQLHLMAKENEDKVIEIDRLRNKMVQALKTAAENHTAHMKIVEEKHKGAVSALKEEIRTHEVTVLKLRAQLSRVDVLGRGGGAASEYGGGAASSIGGGVSSVGGGMNVGGGGALYPLTTTQTMQQHALDIQELELKRLHGEVSSLTIQRDDALFRVERLTISRREESEEAIRQLKKDVALLTARCTAFEERNTNLEEAVAVEKEHRRIANDQTREAQRDLNNKAEELDGLQKELYTAKATIKIIEDRLKAVQKEHEGENAEWEKKVRLCERRTEEVAKDAASARDRLLIQLSDAERAVEETRNRLREATSKFNSLTANFNEKQRSLEVAALNKEQLTQSVYQHKQVIAAADERLAALMAQEVIMRSDLREMAIEVERLRLENMKVTGERDRAAKELATMRKFKF